MNINHAPKHNQKGIALIAILAFIILIFTTIFISNYSSTFESTTNTTSTTNNIKYAQSMLQIQREIMGYAANHNNALPCPDIDGDGLSDLLGDSNIEVALAVNDDQGAPSARSQSSNKKNNSGARLFGGDGGGLLGDVLDGVGDVVDGVLNGLDAIAANLGVEVSILEEIYADFGVVTISPDSCAENMGYLPHVTLSMKQPFDQSLSQLWYAVSPKQSRLLNIVSDTVDLVTLDNLIELDLNVNDIVDLSTNDLLDISIDGSDVAFVILSPNSPVENQSRPSFDPSDYFEDVNANNDYSEFTTTSNDPDFNDKVYSVTTDNYYELLGISL